MGLSGETYYGSRDALAGTSRTSAVTRLEMPAEARFGRTTKCKSHSAYSTTVNKYTIE